MKLIRAFIFCLIYRSRNTAFNSIKKGWQKIMVDVKSLIYKLWNERYAQLRELAHFFEEHKIKEINADNDDVYIDALLKIKQTIEIIDKYSRYHQFLTSGMIYDDSDKIMKKIQKRIL